MAKRAGPAFDNGDAELLENSAAMRQSLPKQYRHDETPSCANLNQSCADFGNLERNHDFRDLVSAGVRGLIFETFSTLFPRPAAVPQDLSKLVNDALKERCRLYSGSLQARSHRTSSVVV